MKFFWVVIVVIVGFIICSCFEDTTKSSDYTGNWRMGDFVDEFNTKTGEKFASRTIYGAKLGRKNSEYTDGVKLTCIISKTNISFEIGGSLTSQTYKTFDVKIQDKNGNRYDTTVSMNPNLRRFTFDKSDSEFLSQKFKEGGPIKFIVGPISPASSTLNFEMESELSYFGNAYRIITQ